jgi:hypothetical protein
MTRQAGDEAADVMDDLVVLVAVQPRLPVIGGDG